MDLQTRKGFEGLKKQQEVDALGHKGLMQDASNN